MTRGDEGRWIPPELVTLGECLAALVAADPGPLAEAQTFLRHVAGAEANVAVGLTRLGHRSAFIGRVGDDGFGQAILRRLRGERVDVSGLTVDPSAPTGVYFRERRMLGPVEVVYHRRGSAGSRLSPADVEAAAPLFAGARWLHLTGITPALSKDCRAAVTAALRLAREQGLTVSLDLNIRRKLWSEEEARECLRALVPQSDVVLADSEEAAVVTGGDGSAPPEAAASSLLDLGARTAVVKLSASGALELAEGAAPLRRPALPVATVVDPVGAGDAFAAGYIAARLEGLDGAAALELGNACGASAVATLGDQTGLPTRAEADRLVRSVAGDAIR